MNVILVNPSAGYAGKAPNKASLNRFLAILNDDHGIPATQRVRRGLDIEAGCGQLKSQLVKEGLEKGMHV